MTCLFTENSKYFYVIAFLFLNTLPVGRNQWSQEAE